MDDFWRLRLHGIDTRRSDARPEPGGPPAMVGQVVTTGDALAVGKFILVNPVRVTAPDVEGEPAVMTADGTREIAVYLLGPEVPATGDYVVARHVDFRWVAERFGAPTGQGSISTPDCPCLETPSNMTMSVSYGPGKTSADYGDLIRSTTFSYGPPPSYVGGFTGDIFFTPAMSIPGSDSQLFYVMTCNLGVYGIGIGVADATGPGFPSAAFAGMPSSCSPFLIASMSDNTSSGQYQQFFTDGGNIAIS